MSTYIYLTLTHLNLEHFCCQYVTFPLNVAPTLQMFLDVIPGSGLVVWVEVVSVLGGTSCNWEHNLFLTRWQHIVPMIPCLKTCMNILLQDKL